MPRSTQLKDCNAGLHSGAHSVVSCICCDKHGIRRDNYASHFATHVKRSAAKDIDAFCEEHSLTYIDEIVLKICGGPDPDKITYLLGVCYACHKAIINKDPHTTVSFEEHVCPQQKKKEKKQKEEAPPDFRSMWVEIGKMKLLPDFKTAYDMNECAPGTSEDTYNSRIRFFLKNMLLKLHERVAAPSTASILDLKKDPEISRYLDLEDVDDESKTIRDQLRRALKTAAETIETINKHTEKHTKKCNEDISEYTGEISKMQQEIELLTDKYNKAIKANECLNAALKKKHEAEEKTNGVDTIEHVV
jgi:hypothetical protein